VRPSFFSDRLTFNNLKSKPGNLTPGIKSQTLDGLARENFVELGIKLKCEKHRFSPGRQVIIPKSGGGSRPLTIAAPRDKVIQEAIRMTLEAIFEPTFVDSSHGFRPSRGCHTAILEITQKFKGCDW